MNTPAHAIVNLLLFGRENRQRHGLVIMAGALIPDAPMLIFYLWAKISGLSERTIWRDGYFDPAWQALFDSFHSFPLLGLGWLIAWQAKKPALAIFFASMFVHSCFDFPLHHNDAHHHLFPFSDWQFHSPVSYWNPAYYGHIAGPIELIVVTAGGAWLLRTAEDRKLKQGVSLILFLYLAYWGFASMLWM